MDNNQNNLQEDIQENVLAGVVGAFLFSLVGGILWFVLYQMGYLAAISGLVGVICAVKGYTFFAKIKNEDKKCIIISTLITAAVLIIAWYFCVGYDIYLVYQEWYAAGEVEFTLTFFESMAAIPYFFEDSEILTAYLKDLGIGLGFAVLGVIYYLSLREKRMKREAESAKLAEIKNQALPSEDEEFVKIEETEATENAEETTENDEQ